MSPGIPVNPFSLILSTPVPVSGRLNPSSATPAPTLASKLTEPALHGDIKAPTLSTLAQETSGPLDDTRALTTSSGDAAIPIMSATPAPTLASKLTEPPSHDDIEALTLSMLAQETSGPLDDAQALATPSGDATTSTPIIVNPLSSLVKKSVKLKLPLLPPIPDFRAKDKITGNEGDGEGVGASNNSSNNKGKAGSNQKSKMRPTKAKTA
ncbi:hypothetical protein JVT61DRAFT_14781 [Boletus reticuloceps]|uniref:Uncharacterized protein n=1 Tax=Boletus reticuloceps TaxID=495285 RepID=A0A8I2YTQ7_9AGAM|nr:hypothetical protein JVT61DRAFT_14781 [Boletus reticuloceps]